MMTLDRLLKLQLVYCLLGIGFNVASWVLLYNGEQALTPTVPISGIVVMSVYGLFLLAGKYRKITLYRILMLLSILVFGYGGVFTHLNLLHQSPELYYSVTAGIIAILINFFGLVLNVMTVLGLFKITSDTPSI